MMPLAAYKPRILRFQSQPLPLRTYSSESSPPTGTPYGELTVGCVKESLPRERRVALTPQNVTLLLKEGFKGVVVERGAGHDAGFPDADYESAGASVVSRAEALQASIVLKCREPSDTDIDMMNPGSSLFSLIKPDANPEVVKKLEAKQITAFAMERIPRTVSRAQTFDVLSSQANLAGYKAVVDAAAHFGRSFKSLMTAAGKVPPAKVLIIGAGVAGLQAIQTAKNTGAIVRSAMSALLPRHQSMLLPPL